MAVITNILSRADGQDILPILAPYLELSGKTNSGSYIGVFRHDLIVPRTFQIKTKKSDIGGVPLSIPVYENLNEFFQVCDWHAKNWGSWSLGGVLTADRDELVFDTRNGEPRPIIQHLADLYKIELKLISSWEGKGCEDVKPIIFRPNTNCIQL